MIQQRKGSYGVGGAWVCCRGALVLAAGAAAHPAGGAHGVGILYEVLDSHSLVV